MVRKRTMVLQAPREAIGKAVAKQHASLVRQHEEAPDGECQGFFHSFKRRDMVMSGDHHHGPIISPDGD